MFNKFQFFSNSILLGLLVTSAACSQGRYSLLAADRDQYWAPQDLCTIPAGNELLGCFSIEVNTTKNLAYMDVKDIDPDSASSGYRVMGRRFDSAVFDVMATNLTTGTGGTFQIYPQSGSDIRDYEEFKVELMINRDQSGISYAQVPAGQGIPMAWGIIEFPEAFEE